MNLEDILVKITALKEKHVTARIDFKLDESDDFVDLYVIAYENEEPVADDLLFSIQEPTKSELEELHLIVEGLKNVI